MSCSLDVNQLLLAMEIKQNAYLWLFPGSRDVRNVHDDAERKPRGEKESERERAQGRMGGEREG